VLAIADITDSIVFTHLEFLAFSIPNSHLAGSFEVSPQQLDLDPLPQLWN